MATLRVISGPYAGAIFTLATERVTVGRDLDNEIRFPDSLVSRHHAEFVQEQGAYRLRDLGSTNGSFLNENRIMETVLQDGQKIRLADVELQFEDSPAPAAEPTSPTAVASAPSEVVITAAANRELPERPAPKSAAETGPLPAKPPLPTPGSKPPSPSFIKPPAERGVWRPPRPQGLHPGTPVSADAPAVSDVSPSPVPPPAETKPVEEAAAAADVEPEPAAIQPPSPAKDSMPDTPATPAPVVPPAPKNDAVAPAPKPGPPASPPPAKAGFLGRLLGRSGTPAQKPASKPAGNPVTLVTKKEIKLAAGPGAGKQVILAKSSAGDGAKLVKPTPAAASPALAAGPAPAPATPAVPPVPESTTKPAPAPAAWRPPSSLQQPVTDSPPAGRPKPVIRTIEAPLVPVEEPEEPVAPRYIRHGVPRADQAKADASGEIVPRYRRAWFALLAFIALLIIIAGYTLDSNPLRFCGILALMVGGLCLVHDWSPLPPKPPRAI